MIRETFKTNSGIMFDSAALKEIGLDPKTLYPIVLPRPPPNTLPTPIPRLPRWSWASLPLSWLFSKTSTPSSSSSAVQNESVFTRTDSSGAVHPDVHGRVRDASEEEEDLKDALMPVYDQLKLRWSWWVLEVIPLGHRFQTEDNEWHWWFG
jgi:hypothetical protein